jgi:kynureninase
MLSVSGVHDVFYFTCCDDKFPHQTNATHVHFSATGNVPLKLHDWGCDFACWCTYKYMNCGPGSIGGCFVHENHSPKEVREPGTVTNTAEESDFKQAVIDPPRFAGWWGHRLHDRFLMAPEFIPCEGVYGFRLSNPPVLLIAGARASLDLFDKVRYTDVKHRFYSIQSSKSHFYST